MTKKNATRPTVIYLALLVVLGLTACGTGFEASKSQIVRSAIPSSTVPAPTGDSLQTPITTPISNMPGGPSVPAPKACVAADLSSPAIRRLNARELANSLRDLLGATVDPSKLPQDDLNARGMDTDGSILRLSDLDAEKYLDAADAAVTAAMAGVRKAEFTCDNAATASTKRACVTTKVQSLARRALKKPASADGLKRYVDFAMTESDVNEGLKKALTALLMDPAFLFLHYEDRSTTSTVYEISSHELAHKLSLMLWSSVPDEALLAAAERGELKVSASLRAQVRRMAADTRLSLGIAKGFTELWLDLYKLKGARRVDSSLAGFSDLHMADMVTESRLLVEHVIKTGRPLSELLTANYSFVNKRLAGIYGIAGSFTDTSFVQTTLPATERKGILTHPSLLAATSKETATSAIRRGHWVTQKVICREPPPPPDNIPALAGEADPSLTMKQRMEAHRSNPVCAGCHVNMDPIGIALENFSPIGKWRTTYGSVPVDSSEVYQNTAFNGPVELVSLIEAKDNFTDCFTEQLATYAIGSALGARECLVDDIVARVNASSSKSFAGLLEEIVDNPLFKQHKVGN